MPTDQKLFRDLTPQQVSENTLPGMVVIDVREPHEWDEGHLENSVLIPLGELQDALHGEQVFENLDRHLVMFCRSGNRSASAAQFLAECGYQNAYNLVGGLIAWTAAGLPVIQD